MQHTKLTEWEWKGFANFYNLADGHAHQPQNKSQSTIIRALGALFLHAEDRSQEDIQHEFEQAFFLMAGQNSYKELSPAQYFLSCSMCIEAAANLLRMKNMSVSLLHPTFDNLADCLKRHNVKVVAVDEKVFLNIQKYTNKIKTDALLIVCPNNPTGLEFSKRQFANIVDFCKKNKKLLILDFSFRFYSNYILWDQYRVLKSSGIDFIVFEDTGKTWPTLDMKIGIIMSSKSLYPILKDIRNDFLLNVSPFIFSLITMYILADKKLKRISARDIVMCNRKVLQKVLLLSPLIIENKFSRLSVEWVRLPKNWDCIEFCTWLDKQNISVLPGIPFYWDDTRGSSYIRIALARDPEKFKQAIIKLSECVRIYHTVKG